MSIAEFERAKFAARAAISAETERHAKALTALRVDLERAEAGVRMAADGLDDNQIAVAEQVIYIRGQFSNGGDEKRSVIEDAVADLAQGAVKLRFQAFGTKSYAHWHGQRSDHGYGYGPKHGDMIFQVGLTKEYQASEYADPATRTPISEEQINACIYCLRNIERIQQARIVARNVASVAA